MQRPCNGSTSILDNVACQTDISDIPKPDNEGSCLEMPSDLNAQMSKTSFTLGIVARPRGRPAQPRRLLTFNAARTSKVTKPPRKSGKKRGRPRKTPFLSKTATERTTRVTSVASSNVGKPETTAKDDGRPYTPVNSAVVDKVEVSPSKVI